MAFIIFSAETVTKVLLLLAWSSLQNKVWVKEQQGPCMYTYFFKTPSFNKYYCCLHADAPLEDLKFPVVTHLVSRGMCSGMQSCSTFAQSFVSCLFLDVVHLSCNSAGFSLVQVSWRVIADGICGQSWSGEMNYLMWLMHLMDLMINSTYNNTIAGKSQLRVRDAFIYDKNDFWRRKWVLDIFFFPEQNGLFPCDFSRIVCRSYFYHES